ncbi:SERT [Mytilus edulis]|uniref:SLC6A4 n=1 Tax=Mytilus edulis TaxID=6550 RepID=A0A8S3T267_MYTED|nr:SERT [Mytilus edulis]
MELALGQYQRCGAISIWNRLCPMFTGLGYGICFVATFVGMYYNTVIAWAVYYLFASFRSEVPWSHCNNTWNTPDCVSVVDGYNVSHVTNNSMLAATEFYLFRVLEDQKAYGIEKVGSPKWQMVLCLIAVFVVVYFSLWKGIKSSGKAVWVTATVPYVVLLILLVRGCTLPGAKDGIIYYLRPQWDKLLKVEVWLDAASQIFFSLGPGFGTLLALSSYNKFHNNCYIDAVATATINCFTSVLAGFVVFSVLGYMAHITQKDIDKVAMEGPGLVFMVYPEALATLDGSVFWSILFFVMLITLGMDSTFGGLEAVITAIMDSFKVVKGRREWLVLGVIIYCFLGSLPSTTNGGQYIVSLLDRHAAPIPLICICFCEAIAVNWFYGVQHFSNDIQSMLGFQPGIFWKICWAFICPICLIVLFILSIYYYDGIELNGYVYPQWSLAIGWTISSISLICIPIYIIYLLIVTPGTFKQKILRMIRPSSIPSHIEQDKSRHLYDKYEISSSNVGTTVNTPVSYNAESISMYSPNQKCYVQREITDSGIAWYSVGCSDAQTIIIEIPFCKKEMQPVLKSSKFCFLKLDYRQRCAVPIGIGKRQRNEKGKAYNVNTMNSSSDANHISEDSVIVCTSCCSDGDLCNRKGCGSPERLPIEGMLCYNCDQQAAPDMCDDITLCGPDKACTISSSKARCCDTELCNDHFLDNSTTHFTKQSTNFVSTTTSTTTQTSPSLTTTTGMRCPYQWHYHESSKYCYLENEGTMTLDEARETCKRYGQHLPIIENLNEQDFIKSIMEPMHVTIWLDGTDITNEGKWVWYTTGQPIGYFNWSPGQPDHYFGVHRENCMDYGPEYNMQWNDAPCHNSLRKHNVLCEGGYQPWTPGEPNDGTEHCLEVVARTEWRWNDGHCEQTGRVNKLVCERYELTAQNVIG